MTGTWPKSKPSPSGGGHCEERLLIWGYLSFHQSPWVFICKKSQTPKVNTLVMKTSEELHEERARPFPAPGAQQDICWLGWPPGPRAHPTAALRLPQALQPRRTGVDVPRAAVAGTIGSVCHVPALVPFCSMASPTKGSGGCICPCSFSGVSGHKRSVSITYALGTQ